jgi:phage FluMu protein Com
MITLTCDNCERKLEVPDDMAGKKVKCPACGDVNLVPGPTPAATVAHPAATPATGPASSPAAAKPDRAAAAGYPSSTGPEKRVLLLRRAMFRARPITLTLLLAALLAGAGLALYGGLIAKPNTPGVTIPPAAALWGGLALAAFGAITLLVWRIRTFDETLEITSKRIIERTGLLSKQLTELRHDDVRNVQVTQSFRQRLFQVGTIGISSSAQDNMEVVAKDIASPNRVREVLDLYRTL